MKNGNKSKLNIVLNQVNLSKHFEAYFDSLKNQKIFAAGKSFYSVFADENSLKEFIEHLVALIIKEYCVEQDINLPTYLNQEQLSHLIEFLQIKGFVNKLDFKERLEYLFTTKKLTVVLYRDSSTNTLDYSIQGAPSYESINIYKNSKLSLLYKFLPKFSHILLVGDSVFSIKSNELYLAKDITIKLVGEVFSSTKNNLFLKSQNVIYQLPAEDYNPDDLTITKNVVFEVEFKAGCLVDNQPKLTFIKFFEADDEINDIINSVLIQESIATEFSEQALNLAHSYGDSVGPYHKAVRKDLTDLDFITIDGSDAKDFDDAIYCRKLKDGRYNLLVGIADVSYYVRPFDSLDQTASKRSSSIYLPTKVIPMLPETLSNGLCSLNPGVDRYSLVADIIVNRNGELEYSFYQACIHSKARLTYDQVQEYLDSQLDIIQNEHLNPQISSMLGNAVELYNLLAILRKERQALEFDRPEVKFEFDADGKVKGLINKNRVDSMKIIEEFMILANRAAAMFVHKHNVPAPHRNHEIPDATRMDSFTSLLEDLEVYIPRTPRSEEDLRSFYSEMQEILSDHQYGDFLNKNLIRTLPRAVYESSSKGHFGLALDFYAQFTSPIRRYPDLLLHRVIKSIIFEDNYELGLSQGAYRYKLHDMNNLCAYSSEREKKIDTIYYKVIDWLKAIYLRPCVEDGNAYRGIITYASGGFVSVELLEFGIAAIYPNRANFFAEPGQIVQATISKIDLYSRDKIILDNLTQVKIHPAAQLDFVVKYKPKSNKKRKNKYQ